MEKFRTEFEIPKSKFEINYISKSIFIGSCFAENIGAKLKQFKFQVDINPFGVLYNPESVANGIKILLEERKFTETDLKYYNDLWYSFYHHGKFSDPDKKASLERINKQIEISSTSLKTAKSLFLTFGTAWIYRLKETQMVVSNCHKLPANLFERELLTIDKIVTLYKDLIDELNKYNQDLKIILTVSPVRHLKDDAQENQVSKSTLILAVNELVNQYDHVEYFPSYEIMMDDLRDYRFYNEDMVHPNKVAIDYIWDKFANNYFSEETKNVLKEVDKILKAKSHRPLNPESDAHQQFLIKYVHKIEELKRGFPTIDFGEELNYFNG